MALRNRFTGLCLALFSLSACGEDRFEFYPEAIDENTSDLCAKVTCKAPDPCQAPGVCDPESGECVYEELADGTSCDDDNACTYGDRCDDGECEGGGEVECRAMDACHMAGECDPETGCSHPNQPDGTACGDNNACTSEDRCEAGACVGTQKTCPPAEQCFEEGMCNAATGECTYVPKAAGAACDPGEVKNCAVGQCDGRGACVLAPVVCKALDSCHEAGECDPNTGACSNPVKNDGATCDDGNVCTSGDVCRAGTCGGATPTSCPAPDACHLAGTCQVGVGCVYPNAPNGTSCEDGDLCTLTDACQEGACKAGARKSCTANGPCSLAGSCDSSTGICGQIPLAAGTSCEDGNLCTENTTCSNGACGGGSTVTCVSTDPCKIAVACDPVVGCQMENAPNGTSCEDGNLCTVNDSCDAGTCKAGTAKTCAALNGCQLPGECNPSSGLCSVRWVQNGSTCTDNNKCTNADACFDGQCVGQSITCDNPCLTNAVCDPNEGRCVGSPVADGTTCSSDSLCATSSACQAGECVTKTTKSCTALDACHAAGFCDETSGECTQPTSYTGSPCADGFCFADVTTQAGLVWPPETELPLRAAGGFVDADGDGLLDILFVSEAHGLLLFLNGANGTFEPAAMPSVSAPTGVSAADYDNDGDVDLFVTSSIVAALLRNDGTGVFTNVAATAGVALQGTSAASTFADFDADGHLDLYVGRQPVPGDLSASANRLYRNQGNGTFQDVTPSAQVGGLGTTMAVVASDIDGDGYPEILVCNDAAPGLDGNVAYDNNGSSTPGMAGRFTALGSSTSFDCLGGSAGDFDRDGDTDYYWAAIGNNVLLRNGAGTLTDRAADLNLTVAQDACTAKTTASWEAGFQDFDADGWLDLYVSNGGDVPGVPTAAPHSPNALFRNNAGVSFTNVAASAGTADPRRGRGVSFGDYDGDGDVDILQLNAKGSPQLLKNQTVSSHGWAALVLYGTESNRDGIGAQVLWSTPGVTRLDERRAGGGASGPSDPRLFTGLGNAQEVHAEIDWPSGVSQHLFYLPRNTSTDVVEPSLTISSGNLSATSIKQGTTVTVNLTMSGAASGGTYSVRLLSGTTPQPTALAPAVLATNTATLTVTVGAAATLGSAVLVVRVTDQDGGKDELMLPLTITVP